MTKAFSFFKKQMKKNGAWNCRLGCGIMNRKRYQGGIMRKFWMMIMTATFLFLTGCVNQKHVEITKSIAQWAINEVEIVDYHIVLVESHPEYEATITWTADQPEKIDFETKTLIPTDSDTAVLLTVTVTYNNVTLWENLTITIHALATEDEEAIANEVAQWMIDQVQIDGSNISLPNEHPVYSAVIVWGTNQPEAIDFDLKRVFPQKEQIEIEVSVSITYKSAQSTVVAPFVVQGVDTTVVAAQFIDQFFPIISRNYKLKTQYTAFGGTTVLWESSHPHVFSSEGIYQAPFNDTPITITYTVLTTHPEVSHRYEKEFIALRMTHSEREQTIRQWLLDHFSENGILDETTVFPTTIGLDGVSLTWYDANQQPLSVLGDVSTYIIPNVGVDLVILVATNDYPFEMKVRYQTEESNLEAVMRRIPSIDLIKEMKVGWNLGNTFDSPSETAWGNPKTTKAMIDAVKNAGFNVLRIPVTWEGHFSETGEYLIDEAWMNRVQEVINYAIDDQTFVILNMHHERWNSTTHQNKDRASLIMEKLWTQIGTRFANYDEHLIFEGMNEPRIYEASASIQWGGNTEAFEVINHLNHVFVNTVRSLGGNNRHRHLMITTNGAGTSEAILSALTIPDDRYVIVSVHAYSPYDFAHDKTTVTVWDKNNPSQTNPIDGVFNRLYDKFIRHDIAVIMGEFASRDKSNLDSRLAWLEYYMTKASNIGIPCVWWDTGQVQTVSNMTFSIFNRATQTWLFPEIVEALMEHSP